MVRVTGQKAVRNGQKSGQTTASKVAQWVVSGRLALIAEGSSSDSMPTPTWRTARTSHTKWKSSGDRSPVEREGQALRTKGR